MLLRILLPFSWSDVVYMEQLTSADSGKRKVGVLCMQTRDSLRSSEGAAGHLHQFHPRRGETDLLLGLSSRGL